MKRFVIENLNVIKELDGVIHDGKFRYQESVKTATVSGSYRKYYKNEDHFETMLDAENELARRWAEKVKELQKRIDSLSDPSTITVLDNKRSLHYANSYLKDEKGFEYNIL